MKDIEKKKEEIRAILIDNIGEAIMALKDWLPRISAKFNDLLLLEAQLKDVNKQKLRGVINYDQYQLEINQIREGLLEFIDALSESNLSTEGEQSNYSYKKGSILYRIPGEMQLQQRYKCKVRIAFDVDTLIENIELDDDVKVEDIRVSDFMEVELIEPPESDKAFNIFALSDKGQFIDKDSFTEWIYYVTPVLAGTYPLVFKVSIVEMVAGKERKRNLVLEEEVQVLSHEPQPVEVLFKASDYDLNLAVPPIPEAGIEPESFEPNFELDEIIMPSPSASETSKFKKKKERKAVDFEDYVQPAPVLPKSGKVQKKRSGSKMIKRVSTVMGVVLALIVGTWMLSDTFTGDQMPIDATRNTWEEIKKTGDLEELEELEEYIRNNPEEIHLPEAKERLKELKTLELMKLDSLEVEE